MLLSHLINFYIISCYIFYFYVIIFYYLIKIYTDYYSLSKIKSLCSRNKYYSPPFALSVCLFFFFLSFLLSCTRNIDRADSILTSTYSELSSSTWQMPFRAPFGTDMYVRNRLRITDSISVLAGTDSFLGTANACTPRIDSGERERVSGISPNSRRIQNPRVYNNWRISCNLRFRAWRFVSRDIWISADFREDDRGI